RFKRHPGGNRWQRFWLVSADTAAERFATGYHRLPARGLHKGSTLCRGNRVAARLTLSLLSLRRSGPLPLHSLQRRLLRRGENVRSRSALRKCPFRPLALRPWTSAVQRTKGVEMSLQQNSAAVAAARAHVEAWSRRDYDVARAALADDVWVTAIAADPNFPKTDLKGVDAYMQGLIQYADGIVPGSTEVVEGVGDDKQALLTVNARVKYGP